MWPWNKRERKKSYPESQGNYTGYKNYPKHRNREVSKIGIRFLTKKGILKIGREHPVETVDEALVLSWGFLSPESYSYDIFKGPKL